MSPGSGRFVLADDVDVAVSSGIHRIESISGLLSRCDNQENRVGEGRILSSSANGEVIELSGHHIHHFSIRSSVDCVRSHHHIYQY